MITIKINTSNDAFGDNRFAVGSELARIFTKLARLAGDLGADALSDLKILDANGNECGHVRCTGDGWPTPPVGRPGLPIEDWVEPVALRIADMVTGIDSEDRGLVEQALIQAFKNEPEVIRPLIGTGIIENDYFSGETDQEEEEPSLL